MLKNYFRIAWRNLWKNKTFTLPNLGSLTISLAACVVIYFWTNEELNYDTASCKTNRVFSAADGSLFPNSREDNNIYIYAKNFFSSTDRDFDLFILRCAAETIF